MPFVNSLPVLYSFRRCPYAIRARLALYYSQLNVELREVQLKQKPEAMLALSPKGTVPVLVLANGLVIDESLDIINWALGQKDPEQLLQGLTARQLQQARQLIAFNDGAFKNSLDRYKYADRFPQQSAEIYRQQGEIFLDQLEQCLTDSTFLVSDRLSVADIAIFPFIRQFSMVDKKWFDQCDYARVQSWLQHQLVSVAFNHCMKKINVWKPEDKIHLFI